MVNVFAQGTEGTGAGAMQLKRNYHEQLARVHHQLDLVQSRLDMGMGSLKKAQDALGGERTQAGVKTYRAEMLEYMKVAYSQNPEPRTRLLREEAAIQALSSVMTDVNKLKLVTTGIGTLWDSTFGEVPGLGFGVAVGKYALNVQSYANTAIGVLNSSQAYLDAAHERSRHNLQISQAYDSMYRGVGDVKPPPVIYQPSMWTQLLQILK